MTTPTRTRVMWTNPARRDPAEAVLCPDHTRSLLRTLRLLSLGCAGIPAPDPTTPCTFCAGRDRQVPGA